MNCSFRSLHLKRMAKQSGSPWARCWRKISVQRGTVGSFKLEERTATRFLTQWSDDSELETWGDRGEERQREQEEFLFKSSVSRKSTGENYGRRVFGAFNYGTTEYASCFDQLPFPDPEDFRASALEYLEEFDAKQWYKDPICSIVNGVSLPHESDPIDTINAMGQVNGRQVLASREQVEKVLKPHICTYQSKWSDLRDEIRQAEQDLLTNYGGVLVGNQCLDFAKQDGATELEEAVMACVVERRLNDYLLMEEKRQHLTVNRKPIFVHCVSNFSNFLDLSRKVIRSLEVGIPVLILGRTNQVQQHSYRWTQLLIEQAVREQGVDPGMITYLSCSLEDIKDILISCQSHTGNLYMTGSRQLAADVTSIYPNTIASTGGPNTMILSTPKHKNPKLFDFDALSESDSTKQRKLDRNKEKEEKEEKEEWFTTEMKQAIYTSAAIESSGQCTALRHVIVPPNFTQEDVESILSSPAKTLLSPVQALRNHQCDGILPANKTVKSNAPSKSAGYNHDPDTDTYWKLNEKLPDPTSDERNGLPEYWRKVVVDYTKMDTDPYDYTTLDQLAHWLNQTQPISVAVNGNMVDSYKNLRRLFDRTALAVYTIGGRNNELIPTHPFPKHLPPALTCQARPQECEIFGEMPPRHEMLKYTKYPVYIPSSNPSYDAKYELNYLRKQSIDMTGWVGSSIRLMDEVQSDLVRGYCYLLVEYLRNVDDRNPREVPITSKGRTVLWGLQRPPLQTHTVLRCASDTTTWDACAPIYMLFHASNARNQIKLSLPPGNAPMKSLCDQHKLSYVVETEDELQRRVSKEPVFQSNASGSNVTKAEDDSSLAMNPHYVEPTTIFQVARVDEPMTSYFPMVGQFTSLYFPMGHVKSTASRDQEFIMRLGEISQKWIHSLF